MFLKTEAAVLFKLNNPLKIIDINLPLPEKGEVLVKVFYSSICHTQLLEIQGKNAAGSFVPNMMGHEAVGEVIKIGKGVKKVKVGQRVILSWIKGKGFNVIPKPINYKNKKINRGGVTTFSKHTVVSENRVFPISKKMPLEVCSLLGCAVPTGMGMILNNAKPKKNSNILIIGCGGVGVNAVQAAKYKKLKNIIVADIQDSKKKISHLLGATIFVNYNNKDKLKKIINEITNNNGLDYCIDTVGKKETMEFAYNVTNNISGRVILCGVPNPPKTKISIDPFPLYFGKTIVGTGGGETIPDKDIKKYEKLYLNKKINLDKMITHTFKLKDINKGLDIMRSKKSIRVLIDMQ